MSDLLRPITRTIWNVLLLSNDGSVYAHIEYYATEAEANAKANELDEDGFDVVGIASEDIEL